MKKFIVVLAVALAAATPAIAQKRPAKAAPQGTVLPHQRSPLSDLNLTPSQQKRVNSLLDAGRKERASLQLSLQKKRVELETARPGSPAYAKIREEMTAIRLQMASARKTTREKVLAVLTPSQRAKLEAKHPHPPGKPSAAATQSRHR